MRNNTNTEPPKRTEQEIISYDKFNIEKDPFYLIDWEINSIMRELEG